MIPDTSAGRNRRTRRELLHQYVHLQRELIDGDASSSAYQGTIHAFRQVGHALISAGFESDLDRLLRIRVLEGGRKAPAPRSLRGRASELMVVEQMSLG